MSLFTTSRPSAAPVRALSPPHASMTRSLSKSEQLARAVAESQASPQIPYRPDSLWSEGGADVIWQGNSANKGRFDGDQFSPPPLPSPAAFSTHTVFSSKSDSSLPEFADANEGSRSDEEDNWDGANTTMTTMSASDSRSKGSIYPPLNSTPLLKAAPPARPKKRVPARLLEQVSRPNDSLSSGGEEDASPAADDHGHSRVSSIGSSIWAGQGSKKGEDAPPMPDSVTGRHTGLLQENSAFANTARLRQSVGSSVYSQTQSPAMEWEDSPRLDQDGQVDEKENRGLVNSENNDGRRRLADGTIVPKMPPMPSESADGFGEMPVLRSRSKKGRQNRSPVLSYADGAEEEERLEQERDFQEHGAPRGLGVTSSMGPKLKKNSPAPWEMPDEEGEEETHAGRSSHELWSMSSRPSGEQLMPPNPRFGSSWARQSVESFRNRSASNGSQAQQANHPPLPSSLKQTSALPNQERTASTVEPLSDGPTPDLNARRSRAKSVSSGAAVVLKGLGLTSSANGAAPTGKKGGKFGKALRGMGAGTRSSSSSSSNLGSMEAKKNQGISSDDYAHLPPSPLPDHRFDMAPSVESRGADADRKAVPFSTSRATLTPERPAKQRIGSDTKMPTVIIDRQSSSNDSYTSTTISNATNSSSQYTAMTSPGLPMENKGDLTEVLAATNGKYRDQTYVPSPKKAVKTNTLSVGRAPNTSSSISSSHSAYSSDRMTTSSPSKGVTERSESATPTKNLSESRSSPALRPGSANRGQAVLPSIPSQGMSQGASNTGPFESTPYKLISLEEARRQQKPAMPTFLHERIPTSSSNKSLDQMSEAKDDVPQLSRHLKNKKSGFLRRFAKDKTEQSDEAAPMPEVKTLYSDASEDIASELRPSGGQSLVAPALSLRPMSSMFNGFAPGMLDTIEHEQKRSKQLSTPPSYLGNGQLSPVFTFSSHDDNNSSRASSQVLYEDATDQQKSPRSDLKASVTTRLPSHPSADSVRSDASSALGLATGFPPKSVSTETGVDGTDLSSSTRAKAMEIEGRIAELLGELVRLRTLNVEDDGVVISHSNASSPNPSIFSPSLLNETIISCANCGCNCAEQKRLQTISQMAAFKPITPSAATNANANTSVLSRGRALKPSAIANAGKFGSHTNR